LLLLLQGPYQFTPQEVGRRRLRNTVLDYLSADKDGVAARRAKAQFDGADCMTDKVAALASLASLPCEEREAALQTFHRDAAGDALILNKWFSLQASADLPDQLARVRALKQHPDFTISNPNRARSLVSAFAMNMPHFHAADGAGYQFISDSIIELDALNPQVAARLASSFSQWRRFDEARQARMKTELERIQGTEGLSKDTFEVVSRCLK
jgi:aminopeptidase N